MVGAVVCAKTGLTTMTTISRKVHVGRNKAVMHLSSTGAFHVDWPSGALHSITSPELLDYMQARDAIIAEMWIELQGKLDAPLQRARSIMAR